MAQLSQIGIITMQFTLATKGELSDHIVFFFPYYANSVASLHIQLACRGAIEVNPGPSGVEKLISSPGQNQNGQSENSANTLWLTHLNCRSLLPHKDELRLIFETNKPFLIAVTETWLRQSVYDGEISIAGFSVLRKTIKRVEGVDVPFMWLTD